MKTYEKRPNGDSLANKIQNSLISESYFVWDVIVNVNEFPPYTKHVSVKMDEDTIIKVYACTDQFTVFTRMIKDEIDVLRFLGFEDSPKPIQWHVGYNTSVIGRSHSKVVIVDEYQQIIDAMLEPKGLPDSPE